MSNYCDPFVFFFSFLFFSFFFLFSSFSFFFFLNHMHLFKVQRQTSSAPSIFLLLKILTAFGQHKHQGLVFISSR